MKEQEKPAYLQGFLEDMEYAFFCVPYLLAKKVETCALFWKL